MRLSTPSGFLPLVVAPKKNKKLRVCINLKKMNAAAIRYHYPLPIMDHVLERVAGAQAYSLLDRFSQYNQLSIAPKDQNKMAFLQLKEALFPTRQCHLG